MEYQVLARKYRPKTFDDLVGQDVLVQSLTNAINNNRLANAYLLTGLRGIGKTTTARILAKALNCIGADGTLTEPTATPCGVCENCLAISEDRHVDVVEMDAASHTQVDNIRTNIIEGISYKPSQARYKIFIIDEIHMLSRHSFNALLKTLEEPPAHVKFIFATTDVHKLPVTVLSRCQRYNLPRLGKGQLAEHLENIAHKEHTALQHDAAVLLAIAAEGSARDGLSLLDQAISLVNGQEIDTTIVQSMLGLTDRHTVYNLFQFIMQGDVVNALDQAQKMYGSGAEPNAILTDLQHVNHLMTRLKVVPNAVNGNDLTVVDKEKGPALSTDLSIPVLTRTWQLLMKGQEELKLTDQPFTALEMILIRLCYVQEVLSGPPESHKTIEIDNSTINQAVPKHLGGPASQQAPKPQNIAVAPIEPNSFDDVVALVEESKERLIAWHLKNQVKLVSFEIGIIKLSTMPETLPNIGGRLADILRTVTGRRWSVDTTASIEQSNVATLAEQRQKKAAEKLETACKTPIIQRAKELFPTATVEIRER